VSAEDRGDTLLELGAAADRERRRAEAAEQRVAELQRELHAERAETIRYIDAAKKAVGWLTQGGYLVTGQPLAEGIAEMRAELEQRLVEMGWTPPVAAGASRDGAPEAAAIELASTAFVSRDLVERAYQVINGAGGGDSIIQEQSSRLAAAGLLLSEALGR
jgi:hypothetical protein